MTKEKDARAKRATRTLPPDPDGQNDDRAAWAEGAVVEFQQITGTDDCDAIADLLCDLLHLCDRKEARFGTFAEALRRAQCNYRDETLEG